jgi:tetratricopeptide (TPR) repeat protein
VARWRVWAGTGVAVALLGACDAARPSTQSPEEARCRDASEALRWETAAAECSKAVERAGRSDEVIVLAARALQRLRRPEALAMAERGFGTSIDATARQIAGSLYLERNRPGEAELLLTQAAIAHRMAGDHAQLVGDLQSLAGCLARQRRLTEALDATHQALLEAQRAGDPRLVGVAHRARARVLGIVGDSRAARGAYIDASSELQRWPQDLAYVLLGHGLHLLEIEDPATAVKLLTDALDVAVRNGVVPVVTAANLNLAQAERALGHAEAAQRHLDALPESLHGESEVSYVRGMLAANRGDAEAADRLLATAATEAPDEDFAWRIEYERAVLAERAGDLARAEQRYAEAIDIVERIRSRSALEMRPWILMSRRDPYEALFAMLASQDRNHDALVIAEKLHARTWLDALVETADPRARPQLNSAGTAARPLSTDELSAATRDREVLIFVRARREWWRIHVDGARVELAKLPADTEQLVAAWDNPDEAALAERLGALLLPDDLAASDRPLYIVAPDRLATLPFAALRRSHRYLIDERPVVRLPGLAALRCKPATFDGSVRAALFADSLADRPLHHARAEVVHARFVTGGRALVGADATVAAVERAGRAPLLHLSVHAVVDATGGALELADGRLTAADIISRGIAPRVAVLAGCATGASDDAEGWGALPSALLAAGTRTVVATLRPVQDAHAAKVMTAFYELRGHQHPAIALAAAKRKLAHAPGNPAPPHMWAWFAVWGAAEPSDCDDHGASAHTDQ